MAGSGPVARKTALNSLSYRAVLRGWAFRPNKGVAAALMQRDGGQAGLKLAAIRCRTASRVGGERQDGGQGQGGCAHATALRLEAGLRFQRLFQSCKSLFDCAAISQEAKSELSEVTGPCKEHDNRASEAKLADEQEQPPRLPIGTLNLGA